MVERSQAEADFERFRRTGDPAALGDVYDALAPELLRIALHLARDAAEAEDVLQATFVVAIERAERFDAAQRLAPWLAGILAHEARRARALRRREPDAGRIHERSEPSPADGAERAELLERLDAAVARLPEAYRPALILRVRHGLSATEIAAALGTATGTVRSQLARGLALLRQSLPASLAGALVALGLVPERGLAAVREAVLAQAVAIPSTVASATLPLLGALAMKKLALSAAALLAIATIVWISRSAELGRPAAPEVDEPRVAELEAPAVPRSTRTLPASASEPTAAGSTAEPSIPVRSEPRGAALVVTAFAPDGATPVEGEVVLLQTISSTWRPDDALAGRTDSSGRARFGELPRGRARVRLLRGGEQDIDLVEHEEARLELRIFAGVAVQGRVVDSSGAPVGQAEVWLSERYRVNIGHALALADANGAFRVESIGPDSYLWASVEGRAPSRPRAVRAMPGETVALQFVLDSPGVTVRGRVLDHAGAPVAGARLLVGVEHPLLDERLDDGVYGFGAPPLRATTSSGGDFELDGVAPGAVRVQVRAAGFAPYDGQHEVEAARVNDIAIVLPPQATVTGCVRDSDGRAIAGATVMWGNVEDFASSWTPSALDGRFSIAGITPGRVVLSALHGAYGSARHETTLSAGEVHEWNPELATASSIEGVVVDERGEPLEGWLVVARSKGSHERTRSDATQPDGRFTIVELEPGAHTLWVQRPNGWRAFPAAIVEDIEPSGIPLRIEVPDPRLAAATLTARVVGPDGEPKSGAEVQLWIEDHALWRSFVVDGTTGEIEIENVPPGKCHVEVRHSSFPWKRLGARALSAGERADLGTIAFEDGGRLVARTRGVPLDRIANLEAMISDASNQESGVVRTVEGELRSGPLAPGRHVLLVRGDGVRMQQVDVVIAPGIETAIDVELIATSQRTLSFELAEGIERPRWLACSVFDASGAVAWFGNALREGEMLAQVSVPPGHYTFVGGGGGGVAAKGSFDVTGSDEDRTPVRVALAVDR